MLAENIFSLVLLPAIMSSVMELNVSEKDKNKTPNTSND